MKPWATILSRVNRFHFHSLSRNSDTVTKNGYVFFDCSSVKHVVGCDIVETEECWGTILLNCGEEKAEVQTEKCDLYEFGQIFHENCDSLHWFLCQA